MNTTYRKEMLKLRRLSSTKLTGSTDTYFPLESQNFGFKGVETSGWLSKYYQEVWFVCFTFEFSSLKNGALLKSSLKWQKIPKKRLKMRDNVSSAVEVLNYFTERYHKN